MRIDVSDLYDAFFEIARTLRLHGEFKGIPDISRRHLGPTFVDLVDEMEIDMFFAACARRFAKSEASFYIRPSHVRRYLVLCDAAGTKLEGAEGEYFSHAFDWGSPEKPAFENRVVAGNLTGRQRSDTTIVMDVPDDSAPRAAGLP